MSWGNSKDSKESKVLPWEDLKNSYGQGLSPEMALKWENLINTFGLDEIYNLQKMKKDDIYMVDPKFIGEDYKGSGTYYTSGPYKGKILLNSTRPSDEMLNTIIPHELIHKESGAMGGILPSDNPYFKSLDKFLTKVGENPKVFANERLAYGQTESGKYLPMSPLYRFYMKGQLGNPYE